MTSEIKPRFAVGDRVWVNGLGSAKVRRVFDTGGEPRGEMDFYYSVETSTERRCDCGDTHTHVESHRADATHMSLQ